MLLDVYYENFEVGIIHIALLEFDQCQIQMID